MTRYSILFLLTFYFWVPGCFGHVDRTQGTVKTIYREHVPPAGGKTIDDAAELSESDAGDEIGDSLFLLISISGATWPTPSAEGNSSQNLVSQVVVLYDKTFTGYSSCDLYHGEPDSSKPDDNKCDDVKVGPDCKYHCVCAHERQPITAACDQGAVGYVEMKGYYNNRETVGAVHPVVHRMISKRKHPPHNPAQNGTELTSRVGGECAFNPPQIDPNIDKVCPLTQACNEDFVCEPRGVCSWFDNAPPGGKGTMNHCQLNFGKKLASSQASFNWYSHPTAQKEKKWEQVRRVSSIHAWCLIDQMAQNIALSCIKSCNQPWPSNGIYNGPFIYCFWASLLGEGYDTQVFPDATKQGGNPDLLAQAWGRAFGAIDGLITWGSPATPKLCFDVRGGSSNPGTVLQIWDCQETNPNQQFSMENGMIVWQPTKNSGWDLCLALGGDGNQTDGTSIILWTCDTTDANQNWTWTDEGYLQLTANTKKCMDVTDGQGAGTKMEIWDCQENANNNQVFGYKYPDYLKNPACQGVSYDEAGNEVLEEPGPRAHVMDKYVGRPWYNRDARTGQDLSGGYSYGGNAGVP